MKALRVQVERVMRPIRASHLRKDRMREELYMHLVQLYEQELAGGRDARSATAAAIDRFGEADNLRRELQAGVPWLERIGFARIPASGPIRRRPQESPLHFLLRSHAYTVATGTVFYLLMGLVVVATAGLRPHRPDQPTTSGMLVFFTLTAAIQSLAIVGQAVASEVIRRGLERRAAASSLVQRHRSIAQVIVGVAGSALLLGGSIMALLLSFESCLPIPLVTLEQFWWITLGASALGVPCSLLSAWSWRAATRRYDNWESLDLDERSAT